MWRRVFRLHRDMVRQVGKYFPIFVPTYFREGELGWDEFRGGDLFSHKHCQERIERDHAIWNIKAISE